MSEIEGNNVCFKLDTGAEVTIVGQKVHVAFLRLKHQPEVKVLGKSIHLLIAYANSIVSKQILEVDIKKYSKAMVWVACSF